MIESKPDPSPADPARQPEQPPSLGQALRDLGPTYVRVGHYLAHRVDLVTPAIQHELMALGGHLPPTPWPAIREVLNESIGADTTERFASINGRPLTSGILTQVHRGELRDGTQVAVKVQRPDALRMVARDWEHAPRLEALLRDAGARLVVPFDDLLDDVKAWLDRELDSEQEMANIERLHELARESKWERIPRPHPELSSSRVLVTDHLSGIPFSDLLLAVGSGRAEDLDRMEDEGVDRRRLARNVALVNLRQIFRYRFFQVDFHPRNLVALDDGRIAFADMGQCGEVDVSLSERQLTYLSAIYDDDLERVLDPPVDIGSPATDSDLVGFRRQLVRGARARGTGGSGMVDGAPESWADRRLSAATELIAEFLHSAEANNVELPAAAHLLYRSVVSAQQAANSLDPDSGVDELTVEFLRAVQLEVAVRRIRPDSLQPTLLSLLALARDSPIQLQKLLSDLADGSFVLNVYTSEAPTVERGRDRRTRVVVGAICSVSVALLLTVPNLPKPAGISVGWLLSPVLGVLYAWIYLQWRRLR